MKLKAILGLAGLMTLSASSQAALMNFTGEIEYHNDVVYTYFTVEEDMTDVRLWTDSWNNGVNFDPITTLWSADGTLIGSNDDVQTNLIDSSQTYLDSGLSLSLMSAGEYVFTIGTYNNYAAGKNISDGFDFDSEDPTAIEKWNQPASGTGMEPFWSVWLDGVSDASYAINGDLPTTSVPEPSSFILLLLGTLGLGFARKKTA